MNNSSQNQTATIQSVNLIDGQFSPSDASDIITAMLDKKINYHKIKIMCISEGNHNDPCVHDNSRLNELEAEKSRLKSIIQNARRSGQKLQISSLINIEIID